MKIKNIIAGVILVLAGVLLFAYYEQRIKPEREANEILEESKLVFERGDKESINKSVDLLNKIIVKYPKSKSVPKAYYYVGLSYEKLGLHRLAYLKYSYLVKNQMLASNSRFKNEVLTRMGKLKIMLNYSEEGVNQLYTVLNNSSSSEHRSRVYTELGHTYLKSGNLAQAKQSFDLALREDGNSEEALLGRARTLKRLGKLEDAYDEYDNFMREFSATSQYTKDVLAAYKQQVYQSGLDSYRAGDYYRAIGFYNRLMRYFSNDKISENVLYWLGECNYSLKRFDTAISYFNKVLLNNFYNKDEDARIKKGYSYFMSKRFDLAAREFQIYLQQYGRGKYADTAAKWKKMSTKELVYRIESEPVPEVKTEEEEFPAIDEEKAPVENKVKPEKSEEKLNLQSDDEVSGVAGYSREIYLDNVTEL